MVLESSLQEAAQEKKKSPLRAATWGQLAPQPVSGAQGLQDLQLWTREQADFLGHLCEEACWHSFIFNFQQNKNENNQNPAGNSDLFVLS